MTTELAPCTKCNGMRMQKVIEDKEIDIPDGHRYLLLECETCGSRNDGYYDPEDTIDLVFRAPE